MALCANVRAEDQSKAEKDPDKMFMKMAAIHGMAEQQIAELAQQKGQSQEVKQLAQQMVTDHTKANQELRQLAQSKGVQIPSDLPDLKKQEVAFFQQLEGQQFDQEFISYMKAAHAHDVSKYQDKAQLAKDQELKQWVAGKVPELQHHMQMVVAMSPTGNPAEAQTAGSRQGADHSSGSTGSQSGQSGQSGHSGHSGSSGSGASGSSGSGASGSGASGSGSSSSGTSGSQSGSGTSR